MAVVRCLCFSFEWVLGVEFRCSPVGVMVWRLSRRFRFRSPRGVLPPPSPSPPASVSRRIFRGGPCGCPLFCWFGCRALMGGLLRATDGAPRGCALSCFDFSFVFLFLLICVLIAFGAPRRPGSVGFWLGPLWVCIWVTSF